MLSAFERAAREAGFALADTQRAAASHLAFLGAAVAMGPDAVRSSSGVYLWGPVGRGKTWLLDRFFDAVPTRSKVRFHFQRFFRDFNAALAGRPVARSSIAAALERTIGNADVVCFDELYAHETGDAALLTRLLEELLEVRRVPMVVTSNYPPQGLLPDAQLRTSDGVVEVRHRSFERGIAIIERAMTVVGVDDGLDYRSVVRAAIEPVGFRAGRYLAAATPDETTAALGFAWPARPAPVVGLAGGRTIRPRGVHDRCIWFDFSEVCERPVSPGDILGLTGRYTTWLVSAVPRLARMSPEAAQRFVNLIDVLHDADARLVIDAQAPLEELMAGEGLPPDAARARSRLALLSRPVP